MRRSVTEVSSSNTCWSKGGVPSHQVNTGSSGSSRGSTTAVRCLGWTLVWTTTSSQTTSGPWSGRRFTTRAQERTPWRPSGGSAIRTTQREGARLPSSSTAARARWPAARLGVTTTRLATLARTTAPPPFSSWPRWRSRACSMSPGATSSNASAVWEWDGHGRRQRRPGRPRAISSSAALGPQLPAS